MVTRVQFPCYALFLLWLLLQMPHPCIGPLFLGCWVSFVHLWTFVVRFYVLNSYCHAGTSSSCTYAVSSGFLVTWQGDFLNLDNSTAKAYSCYQGYMLSTFLFRLDCQLLHQASKHSITLIPEYIPTHLHVEANFLSWGKLVQSGISFFIYPGQLSCLRLNWTLICCILMYP